MLAWLSENIATVLISLVILAVVGLIVFRMIRNRKKGKSSCSCGCSSCAMKDMCHK